jgi:hypothetical protein
MGEAKDRLAALANPTGECCGTCRFGSEDPSAPIPGQVLCRRYPPLMMIASVLTQPVAEKPKGVAQLGQQPQVIGTMSITQGVQGHFPMMDARASWCGEWIIRREAMQ